MAYMRDSNGRRLDQFTAISASEAVRDVKTIVVIGDSLTEQGGMIPAAPQIKPNAAWTWALAKLGQRFTVLANKGVGGEGAQQMVARFQADVVALAPDVVVIMAGFNNAAWGTDATQGIAATKSNISTMLDMADEAGIRVVLCTFPPRIGANYTGTTRAGTYELNRWITAVATTRPNVILADIFSALAGPDGNIRSTISGGNPSSDGIHLTARGGWAAGEALAQALEPLAPARQPFIPVAGVGLNLLGTPDFNTGSAASAPSSWTTDTVESLTWSNVARAGFPTTPWKQFVLPGAAGQVTISANANVGSNGLAVGDYVQAFLEYELLSLNQSPTGGSFGFFLDLRFWNGSSFASHVSSMEDLNQPIADRSGTLHVAPVPVPSGTTAINFAIRAYGSGTYRLGRPGLYEAAALVP